MTFRCEKCPDGGDVSPTWDGQDWILLCDSCDWMRYPTAAEIRIILNLPDPESPSFIRAFNGENPSCWCCPVADDCHACRAMHGRDVARGNCYVNLIIEAEVTQ